MSLESVPSASDMFRRHSDVVEDPFVPDMRRMDDAARERIAKNILNEAPEDMSEMVRLLVDSLHKVQQENEKLRMQAEHDALTGAYNKGAYETLLSKEVDHAHRHKRGLTLFGIDLDGFKPINDTYGHAAGDVVLQHVAKILHHNTRDIDIVARPGGDEFSVIATNTSPKDSYKILTRLNRVFAKETCEWNGHMLPVRASIGMADLKKGQTVEALKEAADKAMYVVKESKPDRVARGGALPKMAIAAAPYTL